MVAVTSVEGFLRHRETAGEEDQSLAAGHVGQSFGHVAQRAQHAANGEIGRTRRRPCPRLCRRPAAAEPTEANFTPATTCFRRSASSVKFCVIFSAPPNSAMAISRLGPAFVIDEFRRGVARVGLL